MKIRILKTLRVSADDMTYMKGAILTGHMITKALKKELEMKSGTVELIADDKETIAKKDAEVKLDAENKAKADKIVADKKKADVKAAADRVAKAKAAADTKPVKKNIKLK